MIFYPRVLIALRASKESYEVGGTGIGIINFIHKETEATLGYMTDSKPQWQSWDLQLNLWLQGSFPEDHCFTKDYSQTWIPYFHSVPREYMATNRNDCTQPCGFLPDFKGRAYEIPWGELTMLTYVIGLLSSRILFLKRQIHSDRCVRLMIENVKPQFRKRFWQGTLGLGICCGTFLQNWLGKEKEHFTVWATCL